MKKVLTRFENKLSSSPGYVRALEFIQHGQSSKDLLNKTPTQQLSQESTKKNMNIKDLYYESIGKYLKPESPRSHTPDIATLPKKDNDRPSTPLITNIQGQAFRKPMKFQPKLNKKSMKIASKLGDPKDRLMGSSSSRFVEPDDPFTHQPEINKKSQKIASSRDDGKNRWDALYTHGEEKRKNIEKLRSELQLRDKTPEECSFKPQILQSKSSRDPRAVVERLSKWAEVKETKIKEKKEAGIGKDMKECTFNPKLFETKQYNDNFTEIKGVSSFIERGKKIKNDLSLEGTTMTSTTITKDMNKKKYKELIGVLHDELQSLEI